MSIIYISTGSNLGDKLSNCKNGLSALDRHRRIQITGISSFYHSEPMDYFDQDWFVNTVIQLETMLAPGALLKILKAVEVETGRTENHIRFGPRTLDFDIIFYDSLIIETEDLIVPHPRMHLREFVLRPMCDLSPDLLHPVLGKSMNQLLHELKGEKQQCIAIETPENESLNPLKFR